MKKRVLALLLASAMVFGLAACGSKEETTNEPSQEEQTTEEENAEVPETSHIRWAQGLSGNVFVTIAQQQGYFEEVGLEIEEIPLDATMLQSVIENQADIASNAGTNRPLQMIAAGDDMGIIGGFMVEGCMPIIAKEETEWNGVDDFLGAKVADTPTRFPTCKVLYDEGHDPVNDVEWVNVDNDADKIGAVLNDEAKYAVLGTGRMYLAKNTEGIKIVAYTDDITPDYSCCRMVARKSWIDENPTTVKLLDMALLRAQCYFEKHREECVKMMAEVLEADEEYVEAYMMELDHYKLNVDTLKNAVYDTWNYQKAVDLIDASVSDDVLENAMYEDLYKAALDACIEKYHDEDPDFWDAQLAYYEAQNL